MTPELYIFDMDGTLVRFLTDELLEGVADWFQANPDTRWVIATNQGGVGLRYWMETAGFGEPEKYPTEEQVFDHIVNVVERIQSETGGASPERVYYSLAYQSQKSGKWSPLPPERAGAWEWRRSWRKPSPGMILKALDDFNVAPENALMIGDRDEDRKAADAAGVPFAPADKFFGRSGAYPPPPF